MHSSQSGPRPSRASADFQTRPSVSDTHHHTSSTSGHGGRSNSSQGTPRSLVNNVAQEPSPSWHSPTSNSRIRRPNNISTPPRTSSNDSPRTLTLSDRALQTAPVHHPQHGHQLQPSPSELTPRIRGHHVIYSNRPHSGPSEDWSHPAPLWTAESAPTQIQDIDMERELEADADASGARANTSHAARQMAHQLTRRAQFLEMREAAAREREHADFQWTASLATEQSYVMQQLFHHQQQGQQQARQEARQQAQQQAQRDAQYQAQQQQAQAYQQQIQQQQQEQANPAPNPTTKTAEPKHRVFLLNCKYCKTFLSNRGQKAVLLLEPHITLYSTDSIPFNCGPLYLPPPVERTCDCITHSLGCYGCGAQVGYHIVAPCSRCTSSVANHRSSNGHRTVLHRSEISIRERRYVPGEPGVLAAPYVPTSTKSLHSGSTAPVPMGAAGVDMTSSPTGNAPSPPSSSMVAMLPTFTSTARTGSRTIRSASVAAWTSPPSNGSYPSNGNGGSSHPSRGPTDFYAGTHGQGSMAYGNTEVDKGGEASMNSQRELTPPSIRINGTSAIGASRVSSNNMGTAPFTSVKAASGPLAESTARVIKRGDVLYWSDLLPEPASEIGKRQVPLDPDLILNQPLAGR
ncbi:hypothetical protein CF327_g5502 [Tilletia walkeri]|nr:hypothetical protein CF327_g5502 [Tilletia walkeri]